MITVTPTPPAPTVDSIRNGGNAFFESFPYEQISAATIVTATTGVMHHVGVPVTVPGAIVTTITLRWGTTGVAVPTHWFLALYDSAGTPALIGQTADQASTVITASQITSVALAGGAKTLGAPGMYYVGIMVVSGGSQPTLTGRQFVSSTLSGGFISGQKRACGTSGSALTDTAPPTITSVSSIAGQPYVVLS